MYDISVSYNLTLQSSPILFGTYLHVWFLFKPYPLESIFISTDRMLDWISCALGPQRWWRSYREKQAEEEEEPDPALREAAAVCLQSAWRGYRERQRLLRQAGAARVIQRSWRRCSSRRDRAAHTIQAAWRGCQQRDRYHRLRDAVLLLQAASRGYLARKRYALRPVQCCVLLGHRLCSERT